jgi:SAM-dependent methyltransferase
VKTTVDGYQADLAYTHDAGHLHFATAAAPGLLAILRGNGVTSGLVVDLGCGSGLWAGILTDAGYDVLGVDYSAAMIAMAKKRAPRATFRRGSYLDVPLPPCDAVTSVGECFNYLFDRDDDAPLERLFRRVYEALRPGGVFVFDILEPRQLPAGQTLKRYRTGDDWAVLVEVEEDRERRQLTRRITTFRRTGRLYRRSEEVHRLQLYQGRDLAAVLRSIGFRVRLRQGYGDFNLRTYGDFRPHRRHVVVVARKPTTGHAES